MLPCSHQKGTQHCWHLNSSPVNPCWTSDLKNFKIINLYSLSHCLQLFVIEAMGNEYTNYLKICLHVWASSEREHHTFCMWFPFGLQNDQYFAKSPIVFLLIREKREGTSAHDLKPVDLFSLLPLNGHQNIHPTLCIISFFSFM